MRGVGVSSAALLSIFVSCVLPLVASGAEYPARPIRFILPVPAGGSIDPIVRSITQWIAESWGQQIVVDNRPGAGEIIGMEMGANAVPDGYTWSLGATGGLAINKSLYRKLPYDPERDFSPVSLLALQPLIIVVPNQLPARTVKEFIELARSKPGGLNFGSGGIGTTPHLAFELFRWNARVDIVHVPYKGSAPAMTDLLGGQIQVMFTGIPAGLPHVKASRLRGLAVTGLKRSGAAPDVPTVDESGVRGFNVNQWYGIAVPKGTEASVVQRINQKIRDALASQEIRTKLIAQGVDPSP